MIAQLRKKIYSTNLASFHFPTYNLIDAVNCEGRNHRPAWFLQITDYKTVPKVLCSVQCSQGKTIC